MRASIWARSLESASLVERHLDGPQHPQCQAHDGGDGGDGEDEAGDHGDDAVGFVIEREVADRCELRPGDQERADAGEDRYEVLGEVAVAIDGRLDATRIGSDVALRSGHGSLA